MTSQAARHFDPRVLEAFLSLHAVPPTTASARY
jgi:hypothetical protein